MLKGARLEQPRHINPQDPAMPAYIYANVEITDPTTYEAYRKEVPRIGNSNALFSSKGPSARLSITH